MDGVDGFRSSGSSGSSRSPRSSVSSGSLGSLGSLGSSGSLDGLSDSTDSKLPRNAADALTPHSLPVLGGMVDDAKPGLLSVEEPIFSYGFDDAVISQELVCLTQVVHSEVQLCVDQSAEGTLSRETLKDALLYLIKESSPTLFGSRTCQDIVNFIELDFDSPDPFSPNIVTAFAQLFIQSFNEIGTGNEPANDLKKYMLMKLTALLFTESLTQMNNAKSSLSEISQDLLEMQGMVQGLLFECIVPWTEEVAGSRLASLQRSFSVGEGIPVNVGDELGAIKMYFKHLDRSITSNSLGLSNGEACTVLDPSFKNCFVVVKPQDKDDDLSEMGLSPSQFKVYTQSLEDDSLVLVDNSDSQNFSFFSPVTSDLTLPCWGQQEFAGLRHLPKTLDFSKGDYLKKSFFSEISVSENFTDKISSKFHALREDIEDWSSDGLDRSQVFAKIGDLYDLLRDHVGTFKDLCLRKDAQLSLLRGLSNGEPEDQDKVDTIHHIIQEKVDALDERHQELIDEMDKLWGDFLKGGSEFDRDAKDQLVQNLRQGATVMVPQEWQGDPFIQDLQGDYPGKLRVIDQDSFNEGYVFNPDSFDKGQTVRFVERTKVGHLVVRYGVYDSFNPEDGVISLTLFGNDESDFTVRTKRLLNCRSIEALPEVVRPLDVGSPSVEGLSPRYDALKERFDLVFQDSVFHMIAPADEGSLNFNAKKFYLRAKAEILRGIKTLEREGKISYEVFDELMLRSPEDVYEAYNRGNLISDAGIMDALREKVDEYIGREYTYYWSGYQSPDMPSYDSWQTDSAIPVTTINKSADHILGPDRLLGVGDGHTGPNITGRVVELGQGDPTQYVVHGSPVGAGEPGPKQQSFYKGVLEYSPDCLINAASVNNSVNDPVQGNALFDYLQPGESVDGVDCLSTADVQSRGQGLEGLEECDGTFFIQGGRVEQNIEVRFLRIGERVIPHFVSRKESLTLRDIIQIRHYMNANGVDFRNKVMCGCKDGSDRSGRTAVFMHILHLIDQGVIDVETLTLWDFRFIAFQVQQQTHQTAAISGVVAKEILSELMGVDIESVESYCEQHPELALAIHPGVTHYNYIDGQLEKRVREHFARYDLDAFSFFNSLPSRNAEAIFNAYLAVPLRGLKALLDAPFSPRASISSLMSPVVDGAPAAEANPMLEDVLGTCIKDKSFQNSGDALLKYSPERICEMILANEALFMAFYQAYTREDLIKAMDFLHKFTRRCEGEILSNPGFQRIVMNLRD
ncbi:MAG: hypothetical protein VW378_07725 [bacterium]